MRKWCLVMLIISMLTGCGVQTQDPERVGDVEFTVLDLEKVPEELRNVLEEKKAAPFKVTYEDEGYLYICIGYGEQKTSGYSIAVNEFYLGKNAIYVDTSLIGPSKEETVNETLTYPYIVIKTQKREEPVVFR